MLRSHRVPVALLAGLALLSPGTAMAVDGEVLINQAKAEAGNVTPGDAPGFPVTINRKGVYKLIGNLAVPSGVGIAVERAQVTIDLNGYTIRSAPAHQADTAIAAGVPELTVRNGTITSFQNRGISDDFGANAVIEDMRVLFNQGGGVFLGDGGILRRTIVSGNGLDGLSCGHGCLIEHSIIAESQAPGIFTRGESLIQGSVIVNNGSFGIQTDKPSGFADNTMVGNNGGGVQFQGAVAADPNACSSATCP